MSESFGDKIGNNIRKQREKCGLTQEQVAERMRIKRETYNTIENGKRALKDHEIVQLADILKTDCDYILRGVPTKHSTIADTTGLSETAISEIEKMHSSDNKPYERYQIYALDTLLSSFEGRNVLSKIATYLNSDFSTYYIINPYENGDTFIRFPGNIFFGNIDSSVGSMFTAFGQETIEYAAIAQLTEAIKQLKKAMLPKEKSFKTKRKAGDE